MRPDQRVKAMFLQDILQEQLQRRQAAALRETGKGREEEEEDRGLEGGLLARVKESEDSPSYAVDKSKRKVGGTPDNPTQESLISIFSVMFLNLNLDL